MKARLSFLLIAGLGLLTATSPAAFHLMQIEQVIGSINGNTSAQAIQLRMRSFGQEFVGSSSIWVADATGSNRILLLNIAADVANGSGGARVLLTTPAFTNAMNLGGPAFAPDFTLANAIPASYFPAGRLTFEDDFGTIFWSLAWGGAGYTGPHTGAIDNDSNGNFGPAFAGSLPTAGRQGILFQGAFSAPSTTNAADYAFSANPATVTRNSGASFVVVPEPGAIAVLGTLALGALIFSRRRFKAD
jgi:hypothetical protein